MAPLSSSGPWRTRVSGAVADAIQPGEMETVDGSSWWGKARRASFHLFQSNELLLTGFTQFHTKVASGFF